MNVRPATTEMISEAAWRLARMLFSHPLAAIGDAAALNQRSLLPVFGGDEDLFNAAIDELLVMPLRLGSDDEPWADFQVLAAARFEACDDDVVVHYRFHRDFLRLLGTRADIGAFGQRIAPSSERRQKGDPL